MFLGLLVLGNLAGWIVEPTWRRISAQLSYWDLGETKDAAGQGAVLAILGGFRAVAADFVWLANNLAWERRDLARTTRLIRLTSVVDPRPLVFWINGARMLGYDMPVWRIEASGHSGGVRSVLPEQVVAIEREFALLALEHLERARVYHPEEPLLLIESANLHLRKLRDVRTAGDLYRRAAEMPGAPGYAARIHGELLKQQGRTGEALAWLREVHRGLDPADPLDLADVVLGRIRELELRLGVAESERYTP
ncbi:hypothetical protein ASA1KI_25730 [Opitutales bacterium ASA1]|nr:hypothetical protein ASA1KI_25730 [Opitutales bacterium ASA1]